MNKLWGLFKRGLLVACLLLAITGCGQTGPGTGQSGNVGSNNNNNTTSTGTSASSLNSQSSSVSSNPVSGNPELTAHVDQLEFLEGSDPEPNKVLPVVFTLSKPLPDDAVLNIAVDAHYGVGIFAGRIAEGKSLNLSKGTTEFTVHLESYVNNEPEADKYPVWNLSLTMNGATFTLPTDNGIKIIDDDKMSSEDVNSDTGEVVDFDLNGISKPLGDDKFTVTQIKGPTTAFKVSGDKLRLLMPAPNDFTRRGASMQAGDNESVKFQVTSLKGENYELEYELMSSTRFISLRWSYDYDGDGEGDSPGKPDQYLQSVTLNKQGPHHLILNDTVAPKLEFKYLNNRIHINNSRPVEVAVSELHTGNATHLLIDAQVSADGKAIQISDADWEKIKNKVDLREQGVELYMQVNLRDTEAELAQDENYFGQNFDLHVSLRVADKAASVTLDDKIPDAAITGQKLFFVLSDSYKDGPGDGIVIIKPVTQRTTTFNYLYSSDFYIRLVDLSAVYSGDVHALLEKKDVVNSAVTMKVNVAEPPTQTAPEARSAKKKIE